MPTKWKEHQAMERDESTTLYVSTRTKICSSGLRPFFQPTCRFPLCITYKARPGLPVLEEYCTLYSVLVKSPGTLFFPAVAGADEPLLIALVGDKVRERTPRLHVVQEASS